LRNGLHSFRDAFPMDFSIPAELNEHLEAVRAWVKAELYPIEGEFLKKGFTAMLPVLEEKRRIVREKGWWLPQMSKEVGGMGLSVLEHGLLSAELGRTPIGHYCFNCQAPDAGNMEILHKYGTPAQKERFLNPVLAGEARSCFAMTEPEHAGSNPVWMSTTAVEDGGDWVINGHKWFTSAADGADFTVCMAVTDPEGDRYARASMILVPLDTPGFSLVRNLPVMGEEGDGWASHAEVRFEDCRVPLENMLGPRAAGFLIAQERLGPGRIHHCMRWLGISERCFDLMCEYAATRELDPGKPLGTRQFVQGWIAESRAEINAARLSVLYAAWAIDQKGAAEARDEISCIKFYVANVLQRVMDRSLQTLGGLGMLDDTPIAWYFRHERAARIYDGPDEVHMASLARRILRRYGIEVKPG